MPRIDRIRRSRRRPGTLEITRAERSLVPLARGLAVLAGFFDAAGFLAFGHIYLASPVANTTILGVELADMQAFQLTGTALLSFLVGVVLTTLWTHGLVHWRRTAVLSGVAAAALIGFLFLEAGDIYPSLVLLAAAAGGLHCVLERDPQHLQEGMFPSAQMIRLGDALGSRWDSEKSGLIGDHSLFWLCFVVGGVLGTTAWLGAGQWVLAIASLGTGLLAVYVWSIERNLRAR
jgi:uncharacterized membrane protein YoaK (UPF0700 family)